MAAPTRPTGRVLGLHRKPAVEGEHGLRKPDVREVSVTPHGVVGDFNRFREEAMGGAEDQALLVLPVETLQALNREGWPVRPGDLGENVTVEGIAYDALAPPHRVRLGEVTAAVTKACTPCDYLYSLPYVGTSRGPEFLKVMLNRRGWYARVLTPGTIRTGDPVEVLD
jgi:MOSC domain-containing protein YiiM